jgi:hypothetical protein
MKARGKTLKKVIRGSAAASKEFVASQHIPLGKKVYRELAVQDKSDEFFFGEKYVKLDDGSTHLFLELVVDSGVPYQKHNYNHEDASILGSSVPTPTTNNLFKEKRSQEREARIDGVDLIDEIIMNKDVNLEETTRKLINMSEKSPESKKKKGIYEDDASVASKTITKEGNMSIVSRKRDHDGKSIFPF